MKKVAVLKETINGENRVILLPKDIEDIARKHFIFSCYIFNIPW